MGSSVSALQLLNWYRAHRRHLPWRAPPGQFADPYHVWLSEIMLQQTVVKTVIPYYAKFLAAYPDIFALAAAPLDEVLSLWAGLGYYARGRNLHAAAKLMAASGGVPNTVDALKQLPGVGPYTANAIAALAFNLPVLPVDGNVERVLSRLFAITTPLPAAKPLIARQAEQLMTDKAARAAPGDFAQALFDLGATICQPRTPLCDLCPWRAPCQARRLGIAANLPAKAAKPERPRRIGEAYALFDKAGQVLLIRRPPSGLLGGMLALPETPPVQARWRDAGRIEHVFTHFSLTLTVKLALCKNLPPGSLSAPARDVALPSVMRKALDAALNSLDHCA